MTGDMFSQVIARIDAANAQDPETETDATGTHPAALLYGQRMTAELLRFQIGRASCRERV